MKQPDTVESSFFAALRAAAEMVTCTRRAVDLLQWRTLVLFVREGRIQSAERAVPTHPNPI
jgi:hypothetical protein